MEIYRHGDLSFHPIEKLPDGLKEVKHKGKFVLAEGEFTGHKHVITMPKIDLMKIKQDKEGAYYLDLREEADITHEEHKKITLKPGMEEVELTTSEEEYDLPDLQSINE